MKKFVVLCTYEVRKRVIVAAKSPKDAEAIVTRKDVNIPANTSFVTREMEYELMPGKTIELSPGDEDWTI